MISQCNGTLERLERGKEGRSMDGRLIELKAWGCNIDEVMERFLDDEEFYFECYAQAMEDPCFSQLKEALEKHDIKRV